MKTTEVTNHGLLRIRDTICTTLDPESNQRGVQPFDRVVFGLALEAIDAEINNRIKGDTWWL